MSKQEYQRRLEILEDLTVILENWPPEDLLELDIALLWTKKLSEVLLRGSRSGPGTTALQLRLMRLGARET